MKVFLRKYLPEIVVLKKSEGKKIVLIFVLNIFVSLLDILSIFLASVVAINIVPVVQSKTINISKTLEHIQEWLSVIVRIDTNELLILLSVFLILLMAMKTYLALFLVRKNQFLMGRIASRYATEILRNYLKSSPNFRRSMDNSKFLKTFHESVDSLMFQTIGNKILIIHECMSLFIVFIPIVIVAPQIIIAVFALFVAIRFTIYKKLLKESRTLGISANQLIEESNRKLLDIRNIEDEIQLYETTDLFLDEYMKIRELFLVNKSERLTQQSKPKSYLEILVLLCIVPLIYLVWILYSVQSALVVLSMCFILVIRLTPAISKVMSLRLSILQHKSLSSDVLKLEQELTEIKRIQNFATRNFSPEGKTEIIFDKVKVVSENGRTLVSSINQTIRGPGVVLLSGANGVGKTTIFRYIIGKYSFDEGSISILCPSANSNLAISYLPQHPYKLNSNIEQNILIKRDKNLEDRNEMLNRAWQLYSLLSRTPNSIKNIDATSGGEFQKIALARALCTDSDIVLMDEPTNFLDVESIRLLASTINEMSVRKLFLIASHDLEFINHLHLAKEKIWNLDRALDKDSTYF